MVEKMNESVKAQWVAALRSGEYKQGTNTLRNADQFCCLGVLCDIYSAERGGAWVSGGFVDAHGNRRLNYPPEDVLGWAGIPESFGEVVIDGVENALPNHNDQGRTFEQIADAIEAQL